MSLAFVPVSTWDPAFVSEIRAHYPGSRGAPPGKKQAWRVEWGGEPIAWIGLGEPAFKLAARRALGISDARPLASTVCCFIYRRVRPEGPTGRDLLRAWHARAASDWSQRYGWSPVHWETLVLPSAVPGSVPGYCFRRAGYREIGATTGRGACRPEHGRRVWGPTQPKVVLYRGPLPRLSR